MKGQNKAVASRWGGAFYSPGGVSSYNMDSGSQYSGAYAGFGKVDVQALSNKTQGATAPAWSPDYDALLKSARLRTQGVSRDDSYRLSQLDPSQTKTDWARTNASVTGEGSMADQRSSQYDSPRTLVGSLMKARAAKVKSKANTQLDASTPATPKKDGAPMPVSDRGMMPTMNFVEEKNPKPPTKAPANTARTLSATPDQVIQSPLAEQYQTMTGRAQSTQWSADPLDKQFQQYAMMRDFEAEEQRRQRKENRNDAMWSFAANAVGNMFRPAQRDLTETARLMTTWR